ncbi:MAG TPA: hypothetical protein VFR85_03495 [Anaeromyxobacteraceae bacterium]|nr:hypothetical protein [Anaeromyxobacteraceae bacterium]
MKKLTLKNLTLIPLASLALSTAALAQEKAGKPMEMKPTGTPGKVVGERSKTVTATVKAVDQDKRIITLQGKKGEPQSFKVGEQVKRLNEIAPGDTVVVKVNQGLLMEMQAPGAEPAPVTGGAVAERADASRPPGAAAVATVQGTVTIKAIDTKSRMVTLEGPGGDLYMVKAGPKVQLDRAKVGDQFLATYVESVAVSVQKAKKPPVKGADKAIVPATK